MRSFFVALTLAACVPLAACRTDSKPSEEEGAEVEPSAHATHAGAETVLGEQAKGTDVKVSSAANSREQTEANEDRQGALDLPTQRDSMLKRIVEAWRARQARTRTAKFQWDEDQTVTKGSWPATIGPTGRRSPVPPKDIVIRHSRKLVFDACMMRYSYHGPQWISKSGQFLPRAYVSASNGQISTSFYGDDTRRPRRFYPTGFVYKLSYNRDRDTWYVLPLLITYRPFEPDMNGFDPTALALTSEQAEIDHRPCVIVDGPACSYWVDPQHGFVVSRVTVDLKGKPFLSMDISHTHDKSHEWVPSRWNAKLFNTRSGKLRQQFSATVTSYEINPAIARSEFQVQFPPGTRVRDDRDESNYIVRQGGAKRLITEQERNAPASYEELLATKSGKAIPPDYAALDRRALSIAKVGPQEQRQIVDDIKEYLGGKKFLMRNFQLARRAASRIASAGRTEAAVEASRDFAELFGARGYEFSQLGDRLEGAARRDKLIGKEIEVSGTTVNGEKFDWAAYRGKVVLIDFWFMGCRPCLAEFPSIKKMYELYHDDGFDVVGISVDHDRRALREFLEKRGIPWVNLYQQGDDAQPVVKHYGITSFPTHILVDKKGKVVSLEATAEELDRLLGEMLGPARE